MSCSRYGITVLACALFAGCATAGNLKTGQVPFGGVASEIRQLIDGRQAEDVAGIGPPLVAIDTPLSLVGDTVTLPITIYAASSRYIDAKAQEMKELEQRRERERVVTIP